jgi:glycosyltransferase involved in cell wall biosynthesis
MSSEKKQNILLVNPFHEGSHRQWAENLVSFSQKNILLKSLPGRHWKWRMHGAAVHFAQLIQEEKLRPDIILSTDMLDLSTLKALLARELPQTKYFSYFHENQISYPWSPTDQDVQLKRDFHYAFINYTSALAAEKLFFNSHYHLNSFLEGLEEMLGHLPDYVDISTIKQIRNKARVLPLGLDLGPMAEIQQKKEASHNAVPVLLWNHRWEYDKNPEGFFHTLMELSRSGLDFELIVCGQSYNKYPPVFDRAKRELKKHLIHFGYASSRKEYFELLSKADLLPVTNIQDFFGGSTVEAICAGVIPLLPRRLAYPEHIPEDLQQLYIYDRDKDFARHLKDMIEKPEKYKKALPGVIQHVKRYDWAQMISTYDAELMF